jgi:hypothetical protein
VSWAEFLQSLKLLPNGCELPSGSGVISIVLPGLTDVGMLSLELFDEGKHHESICHHGI